MSSPNGAPETWPTDSSCPGRWAGSGSAHLPAWSPGEANQQHSLLRPRGPSPPSAQGHVCEAAVTHGCGFMSLENSKPAALPTCSQTVERRSGSSTPLPRQSLPWGVSRGRRMWEGSILGRNPKIVEGVEGRGSPGLEVRGRTSSSLTREAPLAIRARPSAAQDPVPGPHKGSVGLSQGRQDWGEAGSSLGLKPLTPSGHPRPGGCSPASPQGHVLANSPCT